MLISEREENKEKCRVFALATGNAGLWVAATKMRAPLQNARRVHYASQILSGMLIMLHMP